MTRYLLPLILAAALGGPAAAHPGPGIVVDARGNVYVAGGPANGIFKIDPKGRVTRLLSAEDRKRLVNPHHLALGADGCLYSSPDHGSTVWRITLDGKMTRHYPPTNWSGIGIIGLGGDPMTVDGKGSIILVNGRRDSYSQVLRVTVAGRLKLLAGGDWGLQDGQGAAARFGDLHGSGFAWGPDGSLYLTDHYAAVRRIRPDGRVTTLAGGHERGFRDARGKDARFDLAIGLAVTETGVVFVADARNRRIRQVAPDGTVRTFCGTGERGIRDGPPSTATFSFPCGISRGISGRLYVLEYGGRDLDKRWVRVVDPDGRVSTLATFDAPPAPRR